MKKKEKVFECKNGCKHRYLDMVIISCKDCIKHTGILITKKQKEEISKILNI